MTGPTTLTITDSEQQNAGAGKNQGEGSPRAKVPIYLFHKDDGVIQPLNVPARNAIVHKSPALVKYAVANALQCQANQEGLYNDTGCVVHYRPSSIPFHIEFEISASNNTCQHLASVRNIKAKDPVSTPFDALSTNLTETGSVREESCSTCKDFF